MAAEAFRLAVRVTPNGGRDGLDGWGEDASGRAVLKLRVSAAAADGAANAGVVALLAKTLGVPRSKVRILSGEAARVKLIEVAGLDADEAARALPPRKG